MSATPEEQRVECICTMGAYPADRFREDCPRHSQTVEVTLATKLNWEERLSGQRNAFKHLNAELDAAKRDAKAIVEGRLDEGTAPPGWVQTVMRKRLMRDLVRQREDAVARMSEAQLDALIVGAQRNRLRDKLSRLEREHHRAWNRCAKRRHKRTAEVHDCNDPIAWHRGYLMVDPRDNVKLSHNAVMRRLRERCFDMPAPFYTVAFVADQTIVYITEAGFETTSHVRARVVRTREEAKIILREHAKRCEISEDMGSVVRIDDLGKFRAQKDTW